MLFYDYFYVMNKVKKFFSGVFYLSLISFLLLLLFSSLLFVYFAKDLPRPERFLDRPIVEPTRIYDRTGEYVLYTIYGEERREIIPLSNIPDHFISALLTAEDSRFYEHFGVDLTGIARSILMNFKSGSTVAGGSTISQQFVRSAFLTREKTFMRKVREIILTIELERRYAKEEILEFYLNQIPFGGNAYGIESAAQTYFNKSAKGLSLNESAILVSMLPSPSMLSPFGENINELMRRKDHLIERMKELGIITEEEAEEAENEDIYFHQFANYLRAPHFVMYVKGYLERKYGEDFLMEKGLKVYTTIDFDMQREAERVVKAGVQSNLRFNAHNAALTVIDPKTGEVLVMVGSADYFKDSHPQGCTPGLNCLFEPYPNVSMRNRQPGSAFKPFVFATAFQKGYNDSTIVLDQQTNFGTVMNPYIPKNYDGQFRGEVTLREALAQSLNVPSIRVLRDLAGLEDSILNAQAFGITTLTRPPSFYGLPLVLGGGEVKLLEMVAAYGVFSSGGFYNPPLFVIKITDKDGNIIEENKNTPRRVLESFVANLITDILSDNNARSPVFGLNSPLYFENHNVSVKTGTTQEYRDGWTIGYTSSIVVGVWAGNNDNTSMIRGESLVVAAPMWRLFMEKILD